MPPTTSEYSKEEFARRGDQIYERDVAPELDQEREGQIVAIDVNSSDFEVGENEATASQRLRSRRPDAQIWLRRVGSRYVRRFGPHARSVEE